MKKYFLIFLATFMAVPVFAMRDNRPTILQGPVRVRGDLQVTGNLIAPSQSFKMITAKKYGRHGESRLSACPVGTKLIFTSLQHANNGYNGNWSYCNCNPDFAANGIRALFVYNGQYNPNYGCTCAGLCAQE